jgi:hypothetical protein
MNNSKTLIWHRAQIELEILKELSEKFGVPSYFVLHTKDLSLFHIYKISEIPMNYIKEEKEVFKKFMSNFNYQKMGKKEYSNFIKNL